MEACGHWEIPQGASRVLGLLCDAGFEAYVVGGCVRDAALGRAASDWDICTQARPEQVKDVMAAAGVKTSDTGIKHGTVTVIVDGEAYETTTYRSDGTYSDGRHPDGVEFLNSIEGDLSRRDFTVNAMAYSPQRGLVDLHGGAEDLASGTIRAVGDAASRFVEDALRIMRALRFASVLGFAIEPATAQALHECRDLLRQIAAERIWAELSKLLCGSGAVEILREYADVVAVVLPELEPMFGFDQHNPFHHYDVWEHTLHALAAAPPEMDADLRFAVLLHDVGKPLCLTFDEKGLGHMYGHEKAGEPIADAACRRLHVPNATRERVVHMVRWHMFSIPDTPKAMRRFLLKHGEQGARDLFAVRRCDIAGFGHPVSPDAPMSVAFATAQELIEELLAQSCVFGIGDLAVNGHDLMELGFAQGPQLGQALKTLLEAVVDENVPNDRDALLVYAQELLAETA